MATLAEYLRADRSNARTLAEACKVHTSQLYRIASGKRRASLELALAIKKHTRGKVAVTTLLPELAQAVRERAA